MTALNPDVEVVAYNERLTSANIDRILPGYDLVVDGTDNFPTRYLLNDASVKHDIPVVHASIFRFEGQMTVFKPHDGPCYRCLFPEPPPADMAPSCAEGGVLGVLPGIMGTLQASEALKLLLGIGEPLVGRLLLVDALEATLPRGVAAARPELPGLRRARGRDHLHRLRAVLRRRQPRSPRTERSCMAVKLRMPPILRPQVGGAREVEATGDTLADVLDDLFAQFPSVREQIVDADGNLNRFVNVYVSNEDVRLGEGLQTAVPDGSTVIVLPAMAGG